MLADRRDRRNVQLDVTSLTAAPVRDRLDGAQRRRSAARVGCPRGRDGLVDVDRRPPGPARDDLGRGRRWRRTGSQAAQDQR